MIFRKKEICQLILFSCLFFSPLVGATISATEIFLFSTKIITHKAFIFCTACSTTKKDTLQHPDFVPVKTLSDDFVLDIKYATKDNFLQQAVYDCPECLLRKETAQALLKAHKAFLKMGYRIKLFDCYRPVSVQRKMWKILPETNYVANPSKGSKHNRGAAVDLTLVDSQGNELDMGTTFDFFGEKAHHTYKNLPKKVLDNRKLLKSIMDTYGFKSIYSEWWHYEYRLQSNAPVENFTWPCKNK